MGIAHPLPRHPVKVRSGDIRGPVDPKIKVQILPDDPEDVRTFLALFRRGDRKLFGPGTAGEKQENRENSDSVNPEVAEFEIAIHGEWLIDQNVVKLTKIIHPFIGSFTTVAFEHP